MRTGCYSHAHVRAWVFDDDVKIILIMNNFSFGPNSWIEILTMRQRVERERVEVIRLSKTKGEEHCRENKKNKKWKGE